MDFVFRIVRDSIFASVLLLGLPNYASAQDLTGLGDLPGGRLESIAYAVSADGSVVVGIGESASGNEAFRWTPASGMVGLGFLSGGTYSGAFGVNADGSVVVGSGSSANGTEAFRWTLQRGMAGLGDLPGGRFDSLASDVSDDGTVVVGSSYSARGNEAFRWTPNGGMVGLGDLGGTRTNSGAVGVSADGSVVVGTGSSNRGFEAFRWTQSGGMVGLGFLPGGADSSASGVSANGSVVVGSSYNRNGDLEAFRWSHAAGMVGLGDLEGGEFSSVAAGVNSNGSVVVGSGRRPGRREAFYWTKAGGMVSLVDLLKEMGVDVVGIKLTEAVDVSDDGLVVVGQGEFGNGTEAYIARLDQPDENTLSGLITVSELGRSISQMSVIIEGANTGNFFDLGSLAMVGTNFNFPSLGARKAGVSPNAPMGLGAISAQDFGPNPRQQTGKEFGFAIGALFGHNNDEFEARHANGVAGLGIQAMHGLTIGGGAVLSSSVGELPLSGDFELRSAGGGAFVSYKPNRFGLQLVASGVARQLDLEVDRGYLNGASPDFSNGETSGTAWGGLVRAGFALPFIATSTLTPFAEFSISRTKFKAYVETGGAFPISFDESSHRGRRVRVGAEFRAPVNPSVEGWAWLAWNHRLVSEPAHVAGQVQGLFTFDLPGTEFSRNGGDGGIGTTWKIGSGLEILASLGTSFSSATEPEFKGRIGARIALGSLF